MFYPLPIIEMVFYAVSGHGVALGGFGGKTLDEAQDRPLTFIVDLAGIGSANMVRLTVSRQVALAHRAKSKSGDRSMDLLDPCWRRIGRLRRIQSPASRCDQKRRQGAKRKQALTPPSTMACEPSFDGRAGRLCTAQIIQADQSIQSSCASRAQKRRGLRLALCADDQGKISPLEKQLVEFEVQC
jgi:hypothetical protein